MGVHKMVGVAYDAIVTAVCHGHNAWRDIWDNEVYNPKKLMAYRTRLSLIAAQMLSLGRINVETEEACETCEDLLIKARSGELVPCTIKDSKGTNCNSCTNVLTRKVCGTCIKLDRIKDPALLKVKEMEKAVGNKNAKESPFSVYESEVPSSDEIRGKMIRRTFGSGDIEFFPKSLQSTRVNSAYAYLGNNETLSINLNERDSYRLKLTVRAKNEHKNNQASADIIVDKRNIGEITVNTSMFKEYSISLFASKKSKITISHKTGSDFVIQLPIEVMSED